MLNVAIILGSLRPGRRDEPVVGVRVGVRVTLAVLQLARGLTALARGRYADA